MAKPHDETIVALLTKLQRDQLARLCGDLEAGSRPGRRSGKAKAAADQLTALRELMGLPASSSVVFDDEDVASSARPPPARALQGQRLAERGVAVITTRPCTICGGLAGVPCPDCAGSVLATGAPPPSICDRPECAREHSASPRHHATRERPS